MDPSVMLSDICVLPVGLHVWTVGTSGAGGEILTSIVGMTDGEIWEQLSAPELNSVTLSGDYFISPDSGTEIFHEEIQVKKK